MARRIETHMIAGPAGRLEALLEEPEHDEPREAILVCHPHPQHGGTMHNKVVYRLARGFRKAGAVVLRFNFRGVNLSEGEYGHGFGEVEDAGASLAWLRERYPELPLFARGIFFRLASCIAARLRRRRLSPDHRSRVSDVLQRFRLRAVMCETESFHPQHPRRTWSDGRID